MRIYPGIIIDCDDPSEFAFVDIFKYADQGSINTQSMYLRRKRLQPAYKIPPRAKDWVGVANYTIVIVTLSLILWIAHLALARF